MNDQIIYNKIGEGYNRTRRADPHISQRLFSLLDPSHEKKYFDIGCGTGNYTAALANMGLDLIGIDPSAVMLEEARAKSSKVQWLQGKAEKIPLDSNSMDGAVATLTLHHWTDLYAGFAEVARLLKPGARWIIFTFTPEQEQGYWLNHFFPEIMRRSAKKALPFATVLDAATQAGLTLELTEKYYVDENLEDLFCYSGKHNPEIYFDPAVRKGISTFATLSLPAELEQGLMQLRDCIDNGIFPAIKEQFNNDNGDYLFAVFRKSQ